MGSLGALSSETIMNLGKILVNVKSDDLDD